MTHTQRVLAQLAEAESMDDLDDELHAPGCDGEEYSTCRPVVRTVIEDGQPTEVVNVVWMAWRGLCGAAEWDYV